MEVQALLEQAPSPVAAATTTKSLSQDVKINKTPLRLGITYSMKNGTYTVSQKTDKLF